MKDWWVEFPNTIANLKSNKWQLRAAIKYGIKRVDIYFLYDINFISAEHALQMIRGDKRAINSTRNFLRVTLDEIDADEAARRVKITESAETAETAETIGTTETAETTVEVATTITQ